MYSYADENAVVAIDIMVDGDFVVPDIGSVKYTVRDNAGAAISGLVNVAVTTDTTTTRVSVEVPDTANAKATDIEKRTVSLQYTWNGEFYRTERHYHLIDFINLTATPDQVRQHLGLNGNELRDDEVDLVRAYFEVKNDLVAVDLDTLLVSGDRRMYFANTAVVLKATLMVMPSLTLRVSQSEQSDTLKFTRLSDVDLKALQERTAGLYSDALRVLGGLADNATPTLLILSSPIDPVTNV